MLSKYINDTRKKIVATTLALTLAFSATSFTSYSPFNVSADPQYDIHETQKQIIEKQAELKIAKEKIRSSESNENWDEFNSLTAELNALYKKLWDIEYETDDLEAGLNSGTNSFFEQLASAAKNFDDAVNNQSTNSDKITKTINKFEDTVSQAIKTSPDAPEDIELVVSIVDNVTDSMKDSLDEIDDKIKSTTSNESMELLEDVKKDLLKNFSDMVEELTETLGNEAQNSDSKTSKTQNEIKDKIKQVKEKQNNTDYQSYDYWKLESDYWQLTVDSLSLDMNATNNQDTKQQIELEKIYAEIRMQTAKIEMIWTDPKSTEDEIKTSGTKLIYLYELYQPLYELYNDKLLTVESYEAFCENILDQIQEKQEQASQIEVDILWESFNKVKSSFLSKEITERAESLYDEYINS